MFVPKLKCYRLIDLARAINSNAKIVFTGIRPGEKIHEEMISITDALNTSEFKINDRDNIVHLSRYINNDNHNNKCNESGMSYSSRTICTIQTVFDSDHVHGVSLTQLLLLKGGVLQLGFLHSH